MSIYNRICKFCNKEFQGHFNKIFCSDGCYQEHLKEIEQQKFLKKIEDSKEKYKNLKEGYDYIICQECGLRGRDLAVHIRTYHNMNSKQYKEKYNITKLKCESLADNFRGDKNPAYQHGGKYSPYSDKFIHRTENTKSVAVNKMKQTKKNNPQNENTRLEYYISRGMTEDEAIIARSERQKTFSLEKCIEHDGLNGLAIWQDRQDRWQETLNSKPEEERRRINSSKAMTLEKCIERLGFREGTLYYKKVCKSKDSGSYEWALKKAKGDKFKAEKFYKEALLKRTKNHSCFTSKAEIALYNKLKEIFPELESQHYLRHPEKRYFYDIVLGNKIIEFNGDYWHANPTIYTETDILKYPGKTICKARDVWDKDLIKTEFAIKSGYELLIIWESNYHNDYENIIEQCINFLRNSND